MAARATPARSLALLSKTPKISKSSDYLRVDEPSRAWSALQLRARERPMWRRTLASASTEYVPVATPRHRRRCPERRAVFRRIAYHDQATLADVRLKLGCSAGGADPDQPPFDLGIRAVTAKAEMLEQPNAIELHARAFMDCQFRARWQRPVLARDRWPAAPRHDSVHLIRDAHA